MVNTQTSWLNSTEGMKRWIEYNKDNLIHKLPVYCRYIMMIIYQTKSFKNLNRLRDEVFRVTYAMITKYMVLLTNLGLVEKTTIGRIREYRITEKGEKYCEEILGRIN